MIDKIKVFLNKESTKHIIKFAATGVFNTIHFYLWYILFLEFDIAVNLAFSIAFIISMIGSYFVNSYWTFNVKPNLKSFIKYPLTALPNFIISNIGVYILSVILNIRKDISGLLASIIAIPVTFLVTRYILLKDNNK